MDSLGCPSIRMRSMMPGLISSVSVVHRSWRYRSVQPRPPPPIGGDIFASRVAFLIPECRTPSAPKCAVHVSAEWLTPEEAQVLMTLGQLLRDGDYDAHHHIASAD